VRSSPWAGALCGTLFLLSVIDTPAAETCLAATKSVSAAARTNSHLAREDLSRERSIYEPLIQRTIDAQAPLESELFASALACWQVKNKLVASGELDDRTLRRLKTHWQSQRPLLGRSFAARRDELAAVPTEIIYKLSGRPKQDARLAAEDAIKALQLLRIAASNNPGVSALMHDQQHLAVVSAFRSADLNRRIKRSTGASSQQVADKSVHMTGTAFDLYVGAERTSPRTGNRLRQVRDYPTYRWLVTNAAKFGFVNYYYEPWHWEYVQSDRLAR